MQESIDRSAFLKKLVNKSLDEYKLNYAFNQYKEGKISLGKVAEMTNRSLWEIISLMEQYNIYLNYTAADLQKDLEMIKSL